MDSWIKMPSTKLGAESHNLSALLETHHTIHYHKKYRLDQVCR